VALSIRAVGLVDPELDVLAHAYLLDGLAAQILEGLLDGLALWVENGRTKRDVDAGFVHAPSAVSGLFA
jgi:hypothetical protein